MIFAKFAATKPAPAPIAAVFSTDFTPKASPRMPPVSAPAMRPMALVATNDVSLGAEGTVAGVEAGCACASANSLGLRGRNLGISFPLFAQSVTAQNARPTSRIPAIPITAHGVPCGDLAAGVASTGFRRAIASILFNASSA